MCKVNDTSETRRTALQWNGEVLTETGCASIWWLVTCHSRRVFVVWRRSACQCWYQGGCFQWCWVTIETVDQAVHQVQRLQSVTHLANRSVSKSVSQSNSTIFNQTIDQSVLLLFLLVFDVNTSAWLLPVIPDYHYRHVNPPCNDHIPTHLNTEVS